jgi:hypothetical protein
LPPLQVRFLCSNRALRVSWGWIPDCPKYHQPWPPLLPLTMAYYTFRKVNCVDPCDPNGIMTRQLALLIQTNSAPPSTNTNLSRPVGWLAEPTLVNPVSMVKKITADTVIQQIHVIDPVFGDQILQYITDVEPSVRFSASNDRKVIEALWAKSVPAPKYTPGQARANPHFTPGEVKLDGARSDFTVCMSIL